MENTLSVSLMIAFLLIGAIGVGVFGPEKTEIEYVDKVEYVDNFVETEVEVFVADASEYLKLAVDDFMEYIDDEDKTRCGGNRYDFDEISVSRIYDEHSIYFDDEDYTVNFDIRLKYDEDSERSCRKTFEVETYYESQEDVEISIN